MNERQLRERFHEEFDRERPAPGAYESAVDRCDGRSQASTDVVTRSLLQRASILTLRASLVQAFLVEAMARDALGQAGAAERAVERALDLAEPEGLLLPSLLHPTPAPLERQLRHGATHARRDVERLREPLSESEVRVLRYLPTNLSAKEIAADRKSTRLNSSHRSLSRMPSSA